MLEWLEGIAGPQYVPAILWTLAALVALAVVLVLFRVLRQASSGTFVAGGRNRKTRLAVMDAAAVDSHRRLVLVRRDDVEHLLLIGGSNDIVVEQNIRLLQPARRPAGAETPSGQPQRSRPPEAAPVQVAHQQRPAAPQPPQLRPAAPQPVTQRPHEPTTEIRTAQRSAPPPATLPPLPARPTPPAPATAQATSTKSKAADEDIDETLLQELETTLDNERGKAAPAKRQDVSLEDEMTRLLGELSGSRKK
jgi:hypothetical protein